MATNAQSQHGRSWLDRALDKIKPQPAPPPSPVPPPVDRPNWEHSVDAHRVNKLTVREVGLIVFNETRSFTDRDNANDSLTSARKKISHVIMNGDERLGQKRPVTAPALKPSQRVLRDPSVKAAYDSSLEAAREAYLDPNDPTHGARILNSYLTLTDRIRNSERGENCR